MRNDSKYYQQLFVDMAEDPLVVTVRDLIDVGEASMEERGRLALSLLPELNICWNFIRAGMENRNSRKLILLFMTSLSNSNAFSYGDFAYAVNNASLHPLFSILANEHCPANFLVDYDYPQIANCRPDELQFSGVSFKRLVDGVRGKRISDVADFLRKKEPGLESLTDEMVLGVSGVTFSRP